MVSLVFLTPMQNHTTAYMENLSEARSHLDPYWNTVQWRWEPVLPDVRGHRARSMSFQTPADAASREARRPSHGSGARRQPDCFLGNFGVLAPGRAELFLA